MGLGNIVGGLVGGALSYITGGQQRREGKALINQPYPTQEIPGEITQLAASGLPSEQYTQAMRNIQRQQNAAISSATDRRSGLAMIGKTNQIANDSTLDLDVANANARTKNLQTLARYKDKAWDWNVKNKYQRDYNYGMQLVGAGNQNKVAGFDKMGAGLIAGAGEIGGLFKKNNYRTGTGEDDSLPQY